MNSIILRLFASEAVSSLSRSSRSSKRSLLIPILLKEEVNRSRFLRTSVMEGAGRGDGGEAGSTGWLPKMTPRLGLQISFYNSQKHLKTTNKLEMRVMSWDPLRRGHGVMVLLLYVSESIDPSIKP